jgi:hypothetical protein
VLVLSEEVNKGVCHRAGVHDLHLVVGAGDHLVGTFAVRVGAVAGLEPDRVDDLLDVAELRRARCWSPASSPFGVVTETPGPTATSAAV